MLCLMCVWFRAQMSIVCYCAGGVIDRFWGCPITSARPPKVEQNMARHRRNIDPDPESIPDRSHIDAEEATPKKRSRIWHGATFSFKRRAERFGQISTMDRIATLNPEAASAEGHANTMTLKQQGGRTGRVRTECSQARRGHGIRIAADARAEGSPWFRPQ